MKEKKTKTDTAGNTHKKQLVKFSQKEVRLYDRRLRIVRYCTSMFGYISQEHERILNL